MDNIIQDKQGDTALIVTCHNGHPDIARVLIDHGAMINYHNKVRLIAIKFIAQLLIILLSDWEICSVLCMW